MPTHCACVVGSTEDGTRVTTCGAELPCAEHGAEPSFTSKEVLAIVNDPRVLRRELHVRDVMDEMIAARAAL